MAVGSARPCTPWKPYVATKPGKRLEQPMPDTITVLSGSRSSSANAR